MLTITQAKSHLSSLRKLACAENQYLACVHQYLRSTEIDVLADVRADTFKSYEDIRDLQIEIQAVSRVVDAFLRGGL